VSGAAQDRDRVHQDRGSRGDPRPAGVTNLQGEANAWRIRVGDYRVRYTGAQGRLLVLVVRATLSLRFQDLAVYPRTLLGEPTEGLSV
jgi:mRNA-degrading endonuclease RelE of RelBE toxin-antitoxin system